MGIAHLTPLLKRFAPGSLTTHATSDFRNINLALDASVYLYRFIASPQLPQPRHVQGFYQFGNYLKQMNITPVFVFDGKARNKQKVHETNRRAQLRSSNVSRLTLEEQRKSRLSRARELVKNCSDSSDNLRAQMSRYLTGSLANSGLIDTVVPVTESPPTAVAQGAPLLEDEKLREELELMVSQISHTQGKGARHSALNYSNFITSEEINLFRKLAMSNVAFDQRHLLDSIDQLQNYNHNMLLSLTNRVVRVTEKMKEETMELLEYMGISYVVADHHEAEAMCASFTTHGLTDATASEDTDAVLFGDGPVLRQYFFQGAPVIQINVIKAREELALSREQFVDLCILCGTDFSGKLKGIGAVKGLSLIKKHGSIEEILKHVKNQPTSNFSYIEARKVFNSAPQIPDNLSTLEVKAENPMLESYLKSFGIDYQSSSSCYEQFTNDYMYDDAPTPVLEPEAEEYVPQEQPDANAPSTDPFLYTQLPPELESKLQMELLNGEALKQ
ncbi:PIN domain-like protein [Basidiobolus meristosporus CBS 931.73]|uniref:PIN domain-like protein n=1 Tax=Basidiobolus meristosporus CBS 931.73 TaxID=1314790 RepID=A0A1Y1VRF0_9FUNG|nr:PIN domain-like protein [Basidiobolus meristosporus CBS 931.73]ORY05219.1 PIN domain-like protein [Basidiobolus meristosporus CBS 931.73]|eukprot:ORX63606.1 PIN domain-like protein [Basidiobolus meristosporus CBS 931.73]